MSLDRARIFNGESVEGSGRWKALKELRGGDIILSVVLNRHIPDTGYRSPGDLPYYKPSDLSIAALFGRVSSFVQ